MGNRAAFAAPRELDVLIPTRDRPAELAAALAGLAAQDYPEPFGVVVSDQSGGDPVWRQPAVAGMVRVLRHRGHPVLLERNLPRRGLAQQRQFLLDRSAANRVLFVDDDVWLEPETVHRLVTALHELDCGFVGNFPHGLSFVDDVRPAALEWYEAWEAAPVPERIRPGDPGWDRARLHAAANLVHLADRLALRPGEWRAYRVAWIGACVLFDRERLVAAGGFEFWPSVPEEHAGEDVVAQLRVLERDGGAGILPSGAYHLESPTTVPDRRVECRDLVLER